MEELYVHEFIFNTLDITFTGSRPSCEKSGFLSEEQFQARIGQYLNVKPEWHSKTLRCHLTGRDVLVSEGTILGKRTQRNLLKKQYFCEPCFIMDDRIDAHWSRCWRILFITPTNFQQVYHCSKFYFQSLTNTLSYP